MRVSGMGLAFEWMYGPVAMVSVLFLAACGGDGESPAAPSLDLTNIDAVVERGEDLYLGAGECWDCHGASGEGTDTAPAINHAPSAFDIHYMLNTNPEMADVSERLQATREDIIAIAAYTRSFAGLNVTAEAMNELVASMASARDYAEYASTDAFVVTARDLAVGEVERFDTVIADWERRSRQGSIRSDYTIRVARTYDPGEPKFEPEPGRVYFYENTGAGQPAQLGFPTWAGTTPDPYRSSSVTRPPREIIAYHTFPPEFRASVHSTAVTPDGRYVYITGPRPSYADAPDRPVGGLDSPATIIKADALTLQPVEQLIVGGRMHHAQIFQDRLMLVDTFARDEDGLDVFLMDPDTQEVIGGVRDEDLGGVSYTSFTDNEYIYILMQPAGYGSSSISGYLVTGRYNRGEFAVLRPFWVAKVDSESWEVVQEYPYPGFRANWIVIDSGQENMYVPVGGNSYLNKIDLVTGEIVWTAPTGTGPYGASLTADESQIWVADKGETTGMFGRTMTVIDTERGRQLETVFSGYQVDHVVLSPNGREMWGTSNSDGKIYVFDVETREQTHVIDMPGFGDAHGLVFVWYDDAGEPHVVRDQGGFHSGINPALGNVLSY